MITLNTPLVVTPLGGYDVQSVTLIFGTGGVVTVRWIATDGAGNQIPGGGAFNTTEAALLAQPGATIKLKSLNALAANLGLQAATYTVA